MDKLKTCVELTRADDRGGEVITSIEYQKGMPSTLVLRQNLYGNKSEINLVGKEISIFVQAMREFKYLVEIWEGKDDDD